MPDWLSPFHMPVLSDEGFARAKAEYIAKNGFTITIPGLSDIIKIRTEAPMTLQEHSWWKRKQWDKFSPKRLEEVRKQKQKRKERYLQMLSSPSPAIFQNAGSILTAIDDAQDATSTLAVIGRLATRVLPKALGKLITGPVGVLTTIAAILNAIQDVGRKCTLPLADKKDTERLSRGSPRLNKGKIKNAAKLNNALPNKGNVIEALQTTEQIFGFGLSLGPIVGLIQDIMFGSVRARPGVPVKIKFPVPDPKHWYKAAMKMSKAASLLWSFPHSTDDEELLQWIATAELSFQHLFEYNQKWNPLDNVEDVQGAQVKAPPPWHTLSQEVVEEGPVPPAEAFGWPQTNTLWATTEDLADATQDVATQNLINFMDRNKHSWAGYVGGLCATEGGYYALACLEGEEQVVYEQSDALKAGLTMIKHEAILDPEQPDAKFELFHSYLQDCEETLYNPTMEDILRFCRSPWNDIKLLRTHTQLL